MKKVKWGVLSTANIGMEKVLPAMQQGQWCDIAAIASRSLASAQAAADKLGIAKAYGSYEELIADPSIEAIYNPLPNDLHVPMTLAAARAGKHVLCEKPLALNATQAAELREVAGSDSATREPPSGKWALGEIQWGWRQPRVVQARPVSAVA